MSLSQLNDTNKSILIKGCKKDKYNLQTKPAIVKCKRTVKIQKIQKIITEFKDIAMNLWLYQAVCLFKMEEIICWSFSTKL